MVFAPPSSIGVLRTVYRGSMPRSPLAHVVRGMEMAFVRTDYLEPRRTLMQAWSDFISAQVEALKSDSQSDDS